jgi:hypothetical protein
MKQISVLVFFMITTKFLVAQNNHSYMVQLQGTFLNGKYFPAIAIEKKLKNHDELKIAIGGGFVASRSYYTKDFSYDTINKTSSYTQYFTLPYGGTNNYNYPEYGLESKSLYSGFILKADYLLKLFYKAKGYKYLSLTFGLDVGLYLLNDHYKLTVENYNTKQQRIEQGSLNSRALSLGNILDFKKSINTDLFKSIHNNLFVNIFAEYMFYFDYVPVPGKSYTSLYGGSSPFSFWQYELGIGVGYTFYK